MIWVKPASIHRSQGLWQEPEEVKPITEMSTSEHRILIILFCAGTYSIRKVKSGCFVNRNEPSEMIYAARIDYI